jgi:hypothetical protein
VLLDLPTVEPELVATRPGQTLLADKHYYAREFQAILAELGVRLSRPARPEQHTDKHAACEMKVSATSSHMRYSSPDRPPRPDGRRARPVAG